MPQLSQRSASYLLFCGSPQGRPGLQNPLLHPGAASRGNVQQIARNSWAEVRCRESHVGAIPVLIRSGHAAPGLTLHNRYQVEIRCRVGTGIELHSSVVSGVGAGA